MRGIPLRHLTCPLLLATGVVVGCTQYLEVETPAGTVPPFPPTETENPPPEVGQPTMTPAAGLAGKVAREARKEQVIERFAAAYAAANSPRIAVLFNRTLSDEVAEWRANTRLVVSRERVMSARSGESRFDTSDKLSVSVGVERPADSGARPPLASTRWIWALEDGFLRPFLDIRAKVVDRATIVRLAAASTSRPGVTVHSPPAKQIEMDALRGHADIFVELLVSRIPTAHGRYEFKASAKEVNSGVILANVTTTTWKDGRLRGRRILATSRGYEIGSVEPGQVGRELALDLMAALARRWQPER